MYEGYWEFNKRQGKGLIMYNNGDKFEGYWEIDRRKGKGIYYFTGDIEGKFECNWTNGEMIGKGLFTGYNI